MPSGELMKQWFTRDVADWNTVEFVEPKKTPNRSKPGNTRDCFKSSPVRTTDDRNTDCLRRGK